MPVSTDDRRLKNISILGRGGIVPFLTFIIMLILLFLSILVLIYAKSLTKGEKVVEALSSWIVLIPGAFLLMRKGPPHIFARYLFFAILLSLVNVLSLSAYGFRPPLYLLIPLSLWSLTVPYTKLYIGFTRLVVYLLDLLLIGAFYPAVPVFHYSSLLLPMCVPMALLGWEIGWLSGLAGFVPLFWGLAYVKYLNNLDAGLFLLIWAPILGGVGSALGLILMDYRKLRRILNRLEIFRQMNKEILSKDSFKEGVNAMLKYILSLISAEKYLLRINVEDSEPILFTSLEQSSTFERGEIRPDADILRRRINIAEVQGEIILGRKERFTSEEDELLVTILYEIGPSMEKLYYFERALEAAISDPLTSLANRRYFLYWLREDIRRSIRYKTPLSLLILDIDGFKEYNDRNGHQAGDLALRKIAEKLKSSIRRSDIAARYGGDEFVVLFPYTNVEEAKVVSERIRESIKLIEIPFEKGRTLTMSGGLAMYKEGENPDDFIARVDKLLYVAKEKGGDIIEVE